MTLTHIAEPFMLAKKGNCKYKKGAEYKFITYKS